MNKVIFTFLTAVLLSASANAALTSFISILPIACTPAPGPCQPVGDAPSEHHEWDTNECEWVFVNPCAEGEKFTEDCGCVPTAYICCTDWQKNYYNQVLSDQLQVNNVAYVQSTDAVDEYYNNFRANLAVERDDQISAADAAYAWQLDACASEHPGNDPASVSLRLACEAPATVTHGAAVAAIWTAYGSGIALANAEQAVELAALTAIKAAADDAAQDARDDSCDNW